MQIGGTTYTYSHYIENAKISFLDTCESDSEYYSILKIWLKPLHIHTDFVLGLNFILDHLGGISINRDYVHFYKRITQTPIYSDQKEN